jgi:hypothetical protein
MGRDITSAPLNGGEYGLTFIDFRSLRLCSAHIAGSDARAVYLASSQALVLVVWAWGFYGCCKLNDRRAIISSGKV